MVCRVAPGCMLTQMTLRQLRSAFGEVVRQGDPQGQEG